MEEEAAFNASDPHAEVDRGLPHQNAEAGPSGTGMSKNAMKKAARLARQEAMRPVKRAAERQKRKERNAELRKGYADGTLTAEEVAFVETRKSNKAAKRNTKQRFDQGYATGTEVTVKEKPSWRGAVLLDLGFDELMFDGEIRSMASQISYCYSANRLTRVPIPNVIFTSSSKDTSPRLWPLLEKAPCEKWPGCHWYRGDLQTYQKEFESVSGSEDSSASALPGGISAQTHKLVYLSADSEEELDTLKEDELYIIGGIVDRNRYKNLCQNKAEKLGIRTARLPIGAYIANLPTRKVLTVNQVFQIMTEYIDKRDWKVAFETVIPTRKYTVKTRKKRERGVEGRPGGEEEEEVNSDENQDDGGSDVEQGDTGVAAGGIQST